MNKIDLAGRFAVVTGGAQGFGRAITERFIASGAKVAIWDFDIALAEKTAKEIGDGVTAFAVDVSNQDAVAQARDATLKAFGRIDILVNNAALYSTLTPRALTEWDTALWDKVMAVNVRGPFLMVKHVAPHMIARRAGKIINIASDVAYKGIPQMLPYVTSKGAVVSFTRALARELGEHGIAVNNLAPGFTLSDTGLENTAHVDDEREKVRSGRAFKRDAYPQDLLGTLIFLASGDSDFITGQTILVEGGATHN